MKKFLFLALFCALAANCGESGRIDKISAAGKAEGTQAFEILAGCASAAHDEAVNRSARADKRKRSKDESFKACAGGGAGA